MSNLSVCISVKVEQLKRRKNKKDQFPSKSGFKYSRFILQARQEKKALI